MDKVVDIFATVKSPQNISKNTYPERKVQVTRTSTKILDVCNFFVLKP